MVSAVVKKEAVTAKSKGCRCGEDFFRATLFAFPPGVISAILWATYTGWLTVRARPATVSRLLRRVHSLRMPAWSVVVIAILLCPVRLSAEDDTSGNCRCNHRESGQACSETPKIESANATGGIVSNMSEWLGDGAGVGISNLYYFCA